MNYADILEKLNVLKEAYHKSTWDGSLTDEQRKDLKEKAVILYGELEEIITKIIGIQNIQISRGSGPIQTFANHIEAALLSSACHDYSTGYNQILKAIGKVQQLANDPSIPKVEYSVTNLIQILQRFRECCQYIKEPPNDEKAVQDIMWIMLRSQFDRVEREETLPKFGVKNYRPDFGIPDLQVLIEAKFISEKTQVSKIQEEVLADIPGYLSGSSGYNSLITFVYDSAHKLRDTRSFIEDIRSVDGIIDVIIVPGF